MTMHVVFPAPSSPFDGIGAYSAQLAAALRHVREGEASVSTPAQVESGAVLLQYNPFSYGRRGLAPRLVVQMLRWRLDRRVTKVTTMVHEPFVAPTGAKSFVLMCGQWLQLLAVRALSHAVIVPSADAARRCGRWLRAPAVVGVGSNLPDRRASRATTREALGIDDDTLVISIFGHSETGRSADHVRSAVAAVASRKDPVLLLVLGAQHTIPAGLPPDLRIHCPGLLSDRDLADHLAAADLFLAPYVDGVSTRRTTLMAALQHAVPVIGTDDGRSDAVLLDSASVEAVVIADVERFAGAVVDLAGDPAERRRRGREARALYEREFDWPVVADRILAIAGG